jgi:hypothetical protein
MPIGRRLEQDSNKRPLIQRLLAILAAGGSLNDAFQTIYFDFYIAALCRRIQLPIAGARHRTFILKKQTQTAGT